MGEPVRADTAFQEKRCQPLYMIPLERWNVERSGTSCGKSTKGRCVIVFLLTFNSLSGMECVQYVPVDVYPLEREMNIVSSCRWTISELGGT
jgi:hypothetical protein